MPWRRNASAPQPRRNKGFSESGQTHFSLNFLPFVLGACDFDQRMPIDSCATNHPSPATSHQGAKMGYVDILEKCHRWSSLEFSVSSRSMLGSRIPSETLLAWRQVCGFAYTSSETQRPHPCNHGSLLVLSWGHLSGQPRDTLSQWEPRLRGVGKESEAGGARLLVR